MGEGMLTIGNSFTLRADFWDNIEKDYMKGRAIAFGFIGDP